MDIETWRHGDEDIETQRIDMRHGNTNMETWSHGHGDMETETWTKKRKEVVH
jgi:hypothetical protein